MNRFLKITNTKDSITMNVKNSKDGKKILKIKQPSFLTGSIIQQTITKQ